MISCDEARTLFDELENLSWINQVQVALSLFEMGYADMLLGAPTDAIELARRLYESKSDWTLPLEIGHMKPKGALAKRVPHRA